MPGARALAAAVAALAGAAMLVSASSDGDAAPMPHPFGHKRDDMDVHALRSCLEAGDLSFLGDAETVRSIYEMRSGPYDGDLLQTQAVVTVPDTARSAPILEWLPPIDRGNLNERVSFLERQLDKDHMARKAAKNDMDNDAVLHFNEQISAHQRELNELRKQLAPPQPWCAHCGWEPQKPTSRPGYEWTAKRAGR